MEQKERSQLGNGFRGAHHGTLRCLLPTPALHGHTHAQPPPPESLSPQKQLQNGLAEEATRHMSESWRTSKGSLGPGLTPRAVPGSCLPRLRLGGHFHCIGSPPSCELILPPPPRQLTSPLASGGRPRRAPSLPWHCRGPSDSLL